MLDLNGQLTLANLPPQRELTVRKRDGRTVPFDETRICIALESAFKAEAGISLDAPLPDSLQGKVHTTTQYVAKECFRRTMHGHQLEIEVIQDIVETELMACGQHTVARRYILYREDRRRARALRGDRTVEGQPQAELSITNHSGTREPLNPQQMRREIIRACHGLEDRCSWQAVSAEALGSLFDGVRSDEVTKAMILSAKARVEKEPGYAFVAARLLLNSIYKQILPQSRGYDLADVHREHFPAYIRQSIAVERLSPDLLNFDLVALADALRIERDEQFQFIGLQTLYDRYLIHDEGRRLETPQYFWMRVAMGLAVNETSKTERAIEFYEVLSTFRFISSTPTLFNAGTPHPQLSSCYLSTVMDDLEHIFKVIGDDAKLSKWAGGLGNDWSNVRATGAWIKGTNGTSQGVIPFLKVANDTAVAVNQGGKRKGAMCAYLETWHLDIEDFLELRKNTGDERRRTHDMNTANWIPDLFMKRVREEAQWTLFSPSDVPDLHDLYGAAFESRYREYEKSADAGEIKLFRRVEAVQLWRKMLTMLFETGHPWITFKDPSNIRSPQDHVGVVHSSNLCTEILLNTSRDETAVCNLGSINLARHITPDGLDSGLLQQTIRTAMRMLDNVIDINFYPTPEGRSANLRHRPVGLGIMGFQDALYALRLPYASDAAVQFADESMELIAYHAILASTELAAERGAYPSYAASKWDRGLLPIDSIAILREQRGGFVSMDETTRLDWSRAREAVQRYGMRNSNTTAIAPTATISNITGVSQSIEPSYKNLFAKSNLSGDFTSVNAYLVEDLKRLRLWDDEMLDDLKYYDGSIQEIERIPAGLKELYRTASEIEPRWLIECASRRQKWIDMGQSLNLYLSEPNGRTLADMYMLAWEKGLKTTYYLRTVAATQIEKSTMDVNRRGIQPRWMKSKSASSNIRIERVAEAEQKEKDAAAKMCRVLNPSCEACQ
jgi:ribonucleoside-diphosphate reductase alpha chain